MSVNSSFLILPSNFLSNCFDSTVGNFIFIAFTGANVLVLLPLCLLVLYMGHQRRQKQCFYSTSSCDFLTYHLVSLEMISVLGSILYCVGVFLGLLMIKMVATHAFLITVCGQMFFSSLLCIECYLGVVHPLFYLQMKQGRWFKIRNIIIWCYWLLGCAMMGIVALDNLNIILIIYFLQQIFSLVVMSFCSFSVLRALKRRGPGEGSRDRVDQSKQRAFNTIMAVIGALSLRFGGNLVCSILYVLPQLSRFEHCVAIFSGFWFGLPSSVTAPLLFMHRAGKLLCFKNSKSGHISS